MLRCGSRRQGCGGIREDAGLRRAPGGIRDDAGLAGGNGRRGDRLRGGIAAVGSRRQHSGGIRDGAGLSGDDGRREEVRREEVRREEERPGNVSELGEGAGMNELGGDVGMSPFWFGYAQACSDAGEVLPDPHVLDKIPMVVNGEVAETVYPAPEFV